MGTAWIPASFLEEDRKNGTIVAELLKRRICFKIILSSSGSLASYWWSANLAVRVLIPRPLCNYSRTSVARILMARLPRLFRTRS